MRPAEPIPNPPDRLDLVLGPSTRLMWRSPETVHLELGARAVIVDGLPLPIIADVVSRTSSRPVPSGSAGPAEPKPPDAGSPTRADVRAALDTLVGAGFLWTRPAEADDPRLAPPVPRLAGELAALAARHGEHAAQLLNARHHCSVVIFGNGRVAAHLGSLLAAAGVGRVRCVCQGSVRLLHTAPGGVRPDDEGQDLTLAANDAVRRAAPEVDTTPLPLDERPDLTVLALDAPLGEDRRAALHADGAAHLLVALGTDHGVVGPLVLPGLTSCLRCADLHRSDRDPVWSALAVQLGIATRYGPLSDVTVSTMAVGTAALQALEFLDGGDPACIDGTLEVRPPEWRLRRRSWPAHPDCDCAGPPSDASVPGDADGADPGAHR